MVGSCLSLQIELILGYFLLQLFGFLWVDAFLERHKSHLQVVDLSLQGIVLLLLSREIHLESVAHLGQSLVRLSQVGFTSHGRIKIVSHHFEFFVLLDHGLLFVL